jgi:ferredoxin-thioredoxin reductase catalytic subunit
MRCHRRSKSRAAERWGSFLDTREGLEYLLVPPIRLTGHTYCPCQVDEKRVDLRLNCACSHDIFPAS